jgi:DNA repair exonuclease SbcCD ATPase subunit
MKTIMEIFKLATRLNIKPKDVIGMGGDIVKMGQSLFNTRINPKLTEFVNKKGEIPENIMEQIKIHMRSMKNASESQLELFKLNLKDLVNAKFPPKADVIKLPVSSVKRPGTLADEMANVENQMSKINRTSKKLDDAMKEYENIYKPSDKRIDKEVTKMMDEDGPVVALERIVKGDTPMNSRKYLVDEIKRYNKTVRTDDKTIDELKEILMRLDTEGIPFADGGIANHFRNR